MGNVSGYFWWSKGDTGTLSWFSAEHSEEVTLYMECKEAAR
jgi:membrane-bound inhibitor of C-type lysozyme